MFQVVTRLGLIACQYLAEYYTEDRYVSAPIIAKKYNMNVRALMPALRQLTRVGILRSRVGGSEPGFIFSRNPDEVTVLEIILALEGDREFLCCRESIGGISCNCSSKESCVLHELINSMIGFVKNEFSMITISDYSKGLATI